VYSLPLQRRYLLPVNGAAISELTDVTGMRPGNVLHQSGKSGEQVGEVEPLWIRLMVRSTQLKQVRVNPGKFTSDKEMPVE